MRLNGIKRKAIGSLFLREIMEIPFHSSYLNRSVHEPCGNDPTITAVGHRSGGYPPWLAQVGLYHSLLHDVVRVPHPACPCNACNVMQSAAAKCREAPS